MFLVQVFTNLIPESFYSSISMMGGGHVIKNARAVCTHRMCAERFQRRLNLSLFFLSTFYFLPFAIYPFLFLLILKEFFSFGFSLFSWSFYLFSLLHFFLSLSFSLSISPLFLSFPFLLCSIPSLSLEYLSSISNISFLLFFSHFIASYYNFAFLSVLSSSIFLPHVLEQFTVSCSSLL